MPVTSKYIEDLRTIVAGELKFHDYVDGLLLEIAKSTLGKTMLAYWGTKAPFKRVTSPAQDAALVILEFTKGVKATDAPICTARVVNWEDSKATRKGPDGKSLSDKDFPKAQKLPLIRLPGNGWKNDSGLSVTEGMLLGHADFDKDRFPDGTHMHAVLFHEMCHAFLIAQLISSNWDGRSSWGKLDNAGGLIKLKEKMTVDVAIEEQVVCGLAHGRGLECSENAYRIENKLTLRTSYKAVGLLPDDALGSVKGGETWALGQSTLTEAKKTLGTGIAHVLKMSGWNGAATTFEAAHQLTDLGVEVTKPDVEKKRGSITIDAKDLSAIADLTIETDTK